MNIKIIKNLLILGIAAAAIIIAVEAMVYQKSKPICKNCNVLLISIDTLAAKHLQCYGYERETAPNLCKFGSENFLFSNSYSQSNWTRPSQTSVLTGLHGSTHNVWVTYRDKLDPKYKTIAQLLQEKKYKTYYFGPPLDDGSWERTVYEKGFDVNASEKYDRNSIEQWHEALDILEKNEKKNQPTFMFLHTYFTHDPYLPGDKTDNYKFIDESNKNKFTKIPLKRSEMEIFTND